jgi:predicted DsbA family dithiol-disulfide isomerase/uncharacterized membrane protein
MAGSDKKKKGPPRGGPERARLFNRLIFGIALFGVLLTIHLWIQSERGFSRGCLGLSEPEEAGISECAAVVQSDAGKLFGISNIVYGFFFFGAMATLSFGAILAREERAKKLKLAGFISSAIGICYALFLFSYQVFALGEFCQLCLTTAFTTAVLFAVFIIYRANTHVPTFDLAGLVREIGWFLFMVFVAALLVVADVFFVNRLGTLETATAGISEAPPADYSGNLSEPGATAPVDSAALEAGLASMCRFDDATPTLSNFDGLLVGAPTVGEPDAPVRVVEFFDPNCPHCKALNSVMPQIIAALGDRASVHFKPFPLWPYSYSQVEALYLANDAGKFQQMLDLQMERQKPGGMSISELTDIADEIGMDSDQFKRDLIRGKYRSRVSRDHAQVSRAGIRSVPKVAIEGRFVSSRSLIPQCMDYLVEQVAAS